MGDLSLIDLSWRSALMFSVCLPMLVVAGMLFTRSVERAANRWLAAFLVLAVMAQIPQIIGFSGFYSVWPGLTYAPFSLELFAGAFFLFHAHSLMNGTPLGWRRWLLVPGLLQLGYYSWAFTMLGDYKAKWAYNDAVHIPYVRTPETIIGLALMIYAIIVVSRMIQRYRRFLEATQSAAADFQPRWLNQLIIAIVLAGALFAGIELAPLILDEVTYIGIFWPQVLLTAVIAWLGFQALAQTTIPFPKFSEGQAEAATEAVPDKDWNAEGEVLQQAVTDGQWHLEPRLSIVEVAARMATNESYISRAVNKGLGVTFNRFINGLRVAHAQDLLRAAQSSVLDVAIASGFSSKATFNRVFRDITGQTPRQFKTSQNP
ncbi:MAG: AraC family transcriptional regulator [Pseudomonadota bacterium]